MFYPLYVPNLFFMGPPTYTYGNLSPHLYICAIIDSSLNTFIINAQTLAIA